MTLRFAPTPIAGVHEVTSAVHTDARGHFQRIFCGDALQAHADAFPVRQANLSVTNARGTVRGFHLQGAPASDRKLVRCVRGRAFDVVVDLRPHSATFGLTHSVVLDEHVDRALLIPEGVAHGFQTLSDDVHLLYLHTAAYSPAHESGVRHDDPALAVSWPLPVVLLSARDAQLPSLHEWRAAHAAGVPFDRRQMPERRRSAMPMGSRP